MEEANTILTADATPQGIEEERTVSAAPETPQATEDAKAAWLADADGNLSDGWRSRLPEGIRDAKSLDGIRSLQAMATSYVNAQRMVGADKFAVPKADSPKEEWEKVFDALGRPKDAKDYTLPKELEWKDASQRDGVLKAFHDAGLSDRQASAMMGLYGNLVNEAQGMAEDSRRKGEESLRQEWGLSYERNLATADRALRGLGLAESLQGNQCLNDPAFVKAMARLGQSMGETTLGQADGSGDTARTRLEAILNDPKDAYYDQGSPMHARRVSEVTRLLSMQGGIQDT